MPPLSDSLQKGEPVQIVTTTDDHSFELDEEALKNILFDEDFKSLNICVLSVAGAFRKGKSFLLDFLLRYLHNEDSENWLGREDEPLSGFTWRGGSERETTGIWAWNKLFRRKMSNGDEVAVLLIDTQGAFDSESTVKDCATVFALSTMTSSVQVYNLSQNIQENDLQHLQLFTEYGRLAMEKSEEKPFQSLMFLVRDWSYPYEFDYGKAGGEQVLEKKLRTGNNRHEELENVRIHIGSCFERINCFLMPHPGLAVARKRDFDGRIADIDKEFVDHLKDLAPLLLAPKNLIVKKINGTKVTCKALFEYFKAYVNIYKSSELPEPKTMLQATAEANNLAAVSQARDYYTTEMEKICGGGAPYISPDELEAHHLKILAAAMELFNSCKKMGGDNFSQSYADSLTKEIEEKYDQYEQHNESKNLFNVARSPITLVTTMLLMYILSGMFGLLGMYSFANFANLLLGVSLLMLCVWCYIRYSGLNPEVGSHIDTVTDFMWLQCYAPVYKYIMQSPGSSRRKKD